MTENPALRRPCILLTRPEADAAPVLTALRARGLEGRIAPMLTIRPDPSARVDLTGCQAILFTSANGVRAFADLCAVRDLPAICVGKASAAEARAVGFTDVEAAGGDVASLADTVRARFDPTAGALFHAAGSVTAGDLKGDLSAAGFTVRRVPLYHAETTKNFDSDTRNALDSGAIDAVAFFSPRTAESFVRVMESEGRAPRARTLTAFCLSPAVADAAAALTWAGIAIAARPETPALIDAVIDAFAETPDGCVPAGRDGT